MPALLEIRGLELRFGGIQALAGISLDVAEGECVVLIGPNGSGKTSLFNCITGLYGPQAGAIRFGGHDLLGVPPAAVARRGIARTFQSLRSFLRLTVLDNLLLGRHLHFKRGLLPSLLGLRGQEERQRRHCEDLIELLDLGAYRERPVAECPLAVRRRVELGRALAAEPRLLLLDEPMAGLAAGEKHEVCHWVQRARGRSSLSVLLVEHDLELASRLASRMIALDQGVMIAEGPPLEVCRHPEVARAFLDVHGTGLP